MSFDLQYLPRLQEFRTAVNGAFNDFFLFLSKISYGVFLHPLAFKAIEKMGRNADMGTADVASATAAEEEAQ